MTTFSESAMTILKARYLRNTGGSQETPGDMFARVAEAIGQDDDERRQFFDMMVDLDFLPNSPTLMNAGVPGGQLSACFVLEVADNMDSIFGAIHQAALIHKSGGGTGFAFSRLRPAGDVVGSTGGVASGPVSFMRVFNAATEVVKQGGKRRGANMGLLRVDHPDIEEFIGCKRNEGDLANFNLSVGMTDAFMRAVHDDGDFDLVNPRNGEVVKAVKARALMRQIAEAAWRNGEPGVVFLDTMNRANPTPEYGQYEATNPCIAEGTWVYTTEGMRKVEWLMDAPEVLVDKRLGDISHQASALIDNGVKPLFILRTREGYEVRLTEDHRVMTPRGWVQANDLNENEEIYIYSGEGAFGAGGTRDEGRLLGWLVGDGYIEPEEATLPFYGEKRAIADAYRLMIQSLPMSRACRRGGVVGDRESFGSVALLALAKRFGYDQQNKVSVTDRVMASSEEFQAGFLSALFTADGHVESYDGTRNSVRLTSVSYPMLQNVQRMLLNFGIFSRIYPDTRGEHDEMMPDGHGGEKEYHCRQCYILAINGCGAAKFMHKIGFLLCRKQAALEAMIENYSRGPYKNGHPFVAHFEGLTPDGEGQVYDITEPITHSFVANGVVVHNCGEQPLLPNESCNLGSINLANMVSPYEDGAVDWDKLRDTAILAARFLDRVIDANCYPSEAIRAATMRTRKIGLGVMGWADMLAKLGIAYDSDQAMGLAVEIMAQIKSGAEMASHGRNATLTTIAPTGTLSIIAGVNSGIEPFFSLAYERKNALGEGVVVNPYLRDALGDVPAAMLALINGGGSVRDVAGVPDGVKEVFKTSHEIPWKRHIEMQAAFQKYTDNAVSKTINMPADATVDDIEAAYLHAWELGCKGLTVYRDGSRQEQVLNVGAKPAEKPAAMGKRARPEVTAGHTHKVGLGCGRTLYVTVNQDDAGLCEVFLQTGKSGGCIGAHTEAEGRLVSLALRSGVGVAEIIDQLSGIRCAQPAWGNGGQILSCADAIAKVLSHAGDAGAAVVYKPAVDVAPECAECGGRVEMRDGCAICVDCGATRCGG